MQGVSVSPAEAAAAVGAMRRGAAALTIDDGEAPEMRIERLIQENPVIIFSRRSCCMCHVVKRLLASVGVHPTVIELEENEEEQSGGGATAVPAAGAPAVFIGGSPVGGLEGLVALHLSGRLIPRLREVGALWDQRQ